MSSEIEGRWKLPSSWAWSPASIAGTVHLGRQRSPKDHQGPNMRPYVRSANITWDGWDLSSVNEMNFDDLEFATFRLRDGDVLLNEGSGSADEVGKPAIWEGQIEDCCFQNTLLCFRSNLLRPEFSVAFLRFSARSGHMVERTQGINIFHIGKTKFEQHLLPVPPAAEQGRIIAKLGTLSARLLRAREELDRVTALADRIRAAVLSQAYSGALAGLDAVTELPCDHWITSTFYGPRFSKDAYVSEGIPTARTTDFNSDGTMSLATAPRVACSPSEFAKWGLVEGDLLVTRTGSIGKCAVYDPLDGPVLPSAYLIRVRFSSEIVTRFAWMMFASPQGQAHLGVNSRAVTQPNINASGIRSLPFPVLTLNQQAGTVSAVDTAFARADRLQAEAGRAHALLDRLESAILAKAFRGELVPQDPNDAPAIVLLDRIRAERAAAPKRSRGRKKKEIIS